MSVQRSGFFMGVVVGLLVGLTLALGVALYVTKVPVPFMNKVPQRTADQDAAETEKNRNWDPNSALRIKGASAPAGSASAVVVPAPAVAGRPLPGTTAANPPADANPPRSPPSTRDPAAILGEPPVAPAGIAAARTASAPSTKPLPDPFTYFVQAGAYAQSDDAEQQRARLAMLGFEARLTEREQGGKTMYRVRIGPFDKKDDAESAKEKLGGAGVESALVRVQK